MTELEILAEVQRLAVMSPLAYDLCRTDEAKRLGIGKTTLDREVKRARRTLRNSSNTRTDSAKTFGEEGLESRSNGCSNGGQNALDSNALCEAAKEIIEHPDPMALVEGAIIESGYAGDPTPSALAYIALTSRLLDRPLNVQFLAQSASGKNFTVDTALRLFPPEAYYKLTASSPRALIYTREDFRHRTVVLEECDSIPAEGSAASAIRSLVNDAVMSYETVEKYPETGEFQTRKITKDGPTGMITTGVRALDVQMATRLLSCSLPDSPGQTREVLRAQAKAAQGQTAILPQAEIEKFHSYQRWLAAKNSRVLIPFAQILAEMLPAKAVRERRDFPQLLTVVRTLALMAQHNRPLAEDGSIVAMLDDYSRARRIMAPLFDSVAADGITPAIRETVALVKEGEEVSNTELARRLGLARSTISYRVSGAIRGGWLKNSESRRGYQACLSRGEPLPEEKSALPEVDEVRRRLEPHSNTDSNTSDPLGAQGSDVEVFDDSSEAENRDQDEEDEEAEIDRLARADGWAPRD